MADGEPAKPAVAPILTLAIALAAGTFALVAGALLLLVHPHGTGAISTEVTLQNQSAKTLLFALALFVIVPGAVVVAARLVDAITARAGPDAMAAAVAIPAALEALALLSARVSARLPWGDGLGVLLVAVAIWWVLVAALLWRALHGPWPALSRAGRRPRALASVTAALVFALVLGFTSLRSVDLGAVAVAVAVLGSLAAFAVVAPVRVGPGSALRVARPIAPALELVFALVLVFAIPDVVVFHASAALPNVYFPPGIIQFQQDWLLGPANQLLGGGALLVNDPVSQYGVGFIYLLYGWFHLAPIGYGTTGLLSGLVTAAFYLAGYGLLRAAGVGRTLAISALAVAVVALVWGLYFSDAAFPQQGPLRFGAPIGVVLAATVARRWPARAAVARAGGLAVLAVSAIWSLEMFLFTVVVYLVMAATEAWLAPPSGRRRLLAQWLGAGLGACVAAHAVLALWTLIATGSLPDWYQYWAYVDALVLSTKNAGGISYGFADWSPGLLLGAASMASAAGVALLVARSPRAARQDPAALVALAGLSAYAIVLIGYTDDRSSTYLLPYVALPTVLAAVLWLARLHGSQTASAFARAGATVFAVAVAALMVGAAWPDVRVNFPNTALAHARPGGGLRHALVRLWHPPPIDPRTPVGERLLARYAPATRALILLPDLPDLGTEVLMASHRFNLLSIGDPKAEAFVDSSVWTGTLTRQLQRLAPGQRLLTDRAGLAVAQRLRRLPLSYPLAHRFGSVDNPQTDWILQRLARRFVLVPIVIAPDGLVVAQLRARG